MVKHYGKVYFKKEIIFSVFATELIISENGLRVNIDRQFPKGGSPVIVGRPTCNTLQMVDFMLKGQTF